MRGLAAVAALLGGLGGCRFAIDGIAPPGGKGGDAAVAGDLRAGDAAAGPDLASAPDLADACGTLGQPDPMALQARCALGASPAVDGKLDDWPAGTITTPLTLATSIDRGGDLLWTGNPAVDDADSSVTFGLRWDASYLYLGARIRDNVRGDLSGPFFFNHDAVEVYLDGLDDMTDAYAADDHQLIAQADAQYQEYANGNAVNPPAKGVIAAVGPDDGVAADWALELAVPWKVLGGAAPALGRELGFDLLLDDDDNPVNSQTDHWLLWFNKGGSNCDFQFCGGGSCVPSCSTRAFGTLQLAGR